MGLAASVWSENINLALDIAPKLKAGSIWINCTNLFDASSGFGGYRESGFGREGGKEGLYEYVRPAWEAEQVKQLLRNINNAILTKSSTDDVQASSNDVDREIDDEDELDDAPHLNVYPLLIARPSSL